MAWQDGDPHGAAGAYTLFMFPSDPHHPVPQPESDGNDRSSWPVWRGRVGDREPAADYSHLTPSQRIELVWEATKNVWSLTGMPLDESAFRRDVESVARRGR